MDDQGKIECVCTTTVPTVTLDPKLERLLRSSATRIRSETAARNELIRAAHAAGASLREIAAAVGMDHTGVRKIIIKGQD